MIIHCLAFLLLFGQLFAGPEYDLTKLVKRLKSSNDKTANDASDALVALSASDLDSVVNALTDVLGDSAHPVAQEKAAYTVARIQWGTDETLDRLIDLIAQGLYDTDSRKSKTAAVAAWAVGAIGYAPDRATPVLIQALRQPNNYPLKTEAAFALGSLGGDWETVGPYLVDALNNRHAGPSVPKAAAEALGMLGPNAKPAIIDLANAAVNTGNSPVKQAALRSLSGIARAFRNSSDLLVLRDLQDAVKKLGAPSAGHQSVSERNTIGVINETVESIKQRSLVFLLMSNLKTSLAVGMLILYSIWLLLLRTVVLRRWPMAVLRLNNFLLGWFNFAFPKQWFGGAELSPRQLLLAGSAYHSRVLDAWVNKNVGKVCDEIQDRRRRKDRSRYVPLPVEVDGKIVPVFSTDHLGEVCQRDQWSVAILGEGGVGKTTLAYELAVWATRADRTNRLCKSHRMVPVVIDWEEGVSAIANPQALKNAIRRQLQIALNTEDRISESFCEELLRRRRILLVLDGLSEIPRDVCHPEEFLRSTDPNFTFNALICTSRIDEGLTRERQCTIRPQRIEKDDVWRFLDFYLREFDKKPRLEDLSSASLNLIAIAANKRFTPLFVKLYAKYVNRVVVTPGSQDGIESIPDLILEYLIRLDSQKAIDPRTVQRVAKISAWKCVEEHFYPTSAHKDLILNALEGTHQGAEAFTYLEKLQILETPTLTGDYVQFIDDPVAEYLAGLHLMTLYTSENDWKSFFSFADSQPGAPDSIVGFLTAVHECATAKGNKDKPPDWVVQRLGRYAHRAEHAQEASA